MSSKFGFLIAGFFATAMLAFAEGESLSLPKTIEAGSAFSVQSTGSGKATLLIIGPGQVLERDVQLGEMIFFPAGSLYNAGHYLAILTQNSSTESGALDVLPSSKPMDLGFLAKPSRLPVGQHDGITGAVYVFDAYHNLIITSMPVSFELSDSSGAEQKRIVMTRYGEAWTTIDSTAHQGIDRFAVRIGDLASARVVEQVPGDPCELKMSARESGQNLQLVTEPLRDCDGNAVPDGTIVTFTENYTEGQSIVDVPLKRGIADVQMAAIRGATISVASGVVLGNQIRWEK
ncbi:MAG: hypothetical protein ABSF70_05370 [Terracidiphilus sp.]|jgi:hypothetical protein